MADSILTTSSINSLVSSYTTSEQSKKIDPLTTRRTKYSNLSSAYSTLSDKLDALKTLLSDLKKTSSSTIFGSKIASSSNSDFVSVTATSNPAASSYTLRVNQLAKSDLVLSKNLTSSDYSTVVTAEGSYTFQIKTGDGEGGEYVSNVEVKFEADDFDDNGITNSAVMKKIRDAINKDKAVVQSNAKAGTATYSGGTSTFKININGTEKSLTIDSATTYDDLISQLVTKINNNVTGVTAEKVVDESGNVRLKITGNDASKYISISSSSGYDLVSDLGIGVTKEKGASGIVTASVFSPGTTTSQFSLTSKNSGEGYRITSLSDTSGSALDLLGINLGTSRTSYAQNTSGEDTPGFVYNTSSLNAKLEFNGINMERSSNSITDLVAGATVSLKSVMTSSDDSVTVSFENDTSTIKSKIESFVEKFNEIYSYIKSNSTSSGGTRGLFLGDANASSLLSSLTSVAYSNVSGINTEDISNLSEIGITFNASSGLVISDSTQLESALSDNITQVASLFNSTNGIATNLYSRVNSYIGVTGYLTKAKKTADDSVTTLNDTIKKAQKKIDKAAESLRTKYQLLQQQYANLISTSNLISSISS